MPDEEDDDLSYAPPPVEQPERDAANLADWYSFDSSRVVEAAYDKDSRRLFVRFQKPQPNGTPWTYEEVPPSVWRNLRRSASPGKFVNRVLDGFPYHRGTW